MVKHQLAAASSSVPPTAELLRTIHVEAWGLLTMEFAHDDAGQTLDVAIWRRCSRTGSYAPSGLTLFKLIEAGVPKCGDIDVRGSIDLQFWGTASGAGVTVTHAGLLVEVT